MFASGTSYSLILEIDYAGFLRAIYILWVLENLRSESMWVYKILNFDGLGGGNDTGLVEISNIFIRSSSDSGFAESLYILVPLD